MADGVQGVVDQGAVQRVGEEIRNRNVLTPKQQENAEEANKADHIFKYCVQGRRPVELEWFINDNYHEDRQQLRFNTANNKLEPVPAEKMASRININKAKQLTRGIVSYINREHPIVNVWPGPNTESSNAYSQAKKEQQLIMHWYDHLQINALNKKVTMSGVKYGIGWAKVLWDKDANAPTKAYKVNGKEMATIKGEILMAHSNTYDVYPDFRATSKADMRFINEAFPRTLGELAANPKYDQNVVDQIAADDKSSVSTLKGNNLNTTYKTAEMAHQTDPMQRTGIIRETFSKEFNQDTREWEIILRVTTESNLLLYHDVWTMDEFPYEYYQSDVADEVLQSYGAIKDIRTLQQALSRGASQVEETMQTMGKINWLIPRGSGINVITDKTGQFVQYNPAAGIPHQSAAVNLPNYTEQHITNVERWIDDIGGAHDAFYGKSPGSRASGKLVDQLQQGDSNSLAMYKDNFEDFQVRLYKLGLKTAKKHYGETSRRIPLNARDATGNYMFVDIKASDIAIEDKVQVRSGSVLPFSQNDRMQLAIDLYKEKLIQDPNVALKLAGLVDLENIFGSEQMDIDRQTRENTAMIKGEPVDDPNIAEDHGVHVRVMDELIKSPGWYEIDDEVKKTLMDHRSKHIKMKISLAKLAASMNVDKIKRQETMMVRANSTGEMTPIVQQQWWDKFGIEADSAEIQARGGTDVQDPTEALAQAHAENMLMAQGHPAHVSPGDNHIVHGEQHDAYISAPEFMVLPKSAQQRINEHRKQHDVAAKTAVAVRGLIANSETGVPMPDHTITTAKMKQESQASAQTQEP